MSLPLSDTMKTILRTGGSLDVPATMLSDTAAEMARIAKGSGAHVTFRNPAWLSDTIVKIARIGAGHVTFRYD